MNLGSFFSVKLQKWPYQSASALRKFLSIWRLKCCGCVWCDVVWSLTSPREAVLKNGKILSKPLAFFTKGTAWPSLYPDVAILCVKPCFPKGVKILDKLHWSLWKRTKAQQSAILFANMWLLSPSEWHSGCGLIPHRERTSGDEGTFSFPLYATCWKLIMRAFFLASSPSPTCNDKHGKRATCLPATMTENKKPCRGWTTDWKLCKQHQSGRVLLGMCGCCQLFGWAGQEWGSLCAPVWKSCLGFPSLGFPLFTPCALARTEKFVLGRFVFLIKQKNLFRYF